jgi:hypothetical protein
MKTIIVLLNQCLKGVWSTIKTRKSRDAINNFSIKDVKKYPVIQAITRMQLFT